MKVVVVAGVAGCIAARALAAMPGLTSPAWSA